MLNIYTYWSAHYNETIIIVAKTREESTSKLKEVYIPGCDTDDWIIGGTIPCRENQSMSVHIIK